MDEAAGQPASSSILAQSDRVARRLASRPRDRRPDDRASFTVARFVLAGRPRPRVEDTIRIGENWCGLQSLAQVRLDDRRGYTQAEPQMRPASCLRPSTTDGHVLRDPQHRHAFWLPEDADGDGEIDHIVVAARDGFCR
jgi:CRISPR-associated protein Csb2